MTPSTFSLLGFLGSLSGLPGLGGWATAQASLRGNVSPSTLSAFAHGAVHALLDAWAKQSSAAFWGHPQNLKNPRAGEPSLQDGGYSDGTGIAQAVAAGASEVVTVS